MRAFFIPIVALLVLAGCAGSTSSAMKTWIGATEAQVISAWGAPDLEAQSGRIRVLTYVGRNAYGQIICRKNLTVNSDRIVIGFTHDCPT